MAVNVSPLAGKVAPASMLVNVPRLMTAYFSGQPDPAVPSQRVASITSASTATSGENASTRGRMARSCASEHSAPS